MSDSHSTRSFPSMSSSSEETSSGTSAGLVVKSEQNNNKSTTSPRSVTKLTSNRSSLSSLGSMSSCSIGGTSGGNSLQPQSLNQALARVNNKWDREQRKQDQETTRKVTLLKQRKISAVLKVENLQKSLKSGNEASTTVQSKLKQVKELEEEVAKVDRELGLVDAEHEWNWRKLNLKRAQHVSTIQQLGLLEPPTLYDESSHNRWKSEADLKDSATGVNVHPDSSADDQQLDTTHRKVSPPSTSTLSERLRSGSDPALTMSEQKKGEPLLRLFRSQDENRKPSTESISGKPSTSRPSRWGNHRTPESSPKSGRRNPLRMLSNAIDFRSRRRGHHRPKSADFERVTENPQGEASATASVDRVSCQGSRHLTPPPLSLSYTLSNSRYSLPSLDPNDMEDALEMVNAASFLTNPRTTKKHPLHPLENRNSAPEIVVTGSPKQGVYYQQAPSATATMPSRRVHHGGLEERIQRAKAKVQNGLLQMSSGSSSFTSSTLHPYQTQQPSGPSSITNGLPPSNHNRTKLSTRFQTAQKLNYKLAALSSFSTSIHVKRSRTFNVSDVQEQLAAMGQVQTNNNINNNSGNSKTLPKQLRNAKLKSGSRDSSEYLSMSSGLYRQSSPSSISAGTISGTSSTTSSRKSSNSSSNGGGDSNIRTQINQEALDEIAAFEEFMNRFVFNSDEVVRPPPKKATLGSNLVTATSNHKKKNALRRLAAVQMDSSKAVPLQRQKQLSSQESDEYTLT